MFSDGVDAEHARQSQVQMADPLNTFLLFVIPTKEVLREIKSQQRKICDGLSLL